MDPWTLESITLEDIKMQKKTIGTDSAFARHDQPGLTKREYMATEILAAHTARSGVPWSPEQVENILLTVDLLIASLNKDQPI